MRDTDNIYCGYLGLMMIYALMNLPIAVLLMKSFFDDVPKEVDEAAMIDGATRWFRPSGSIVLPMVRGGVAASAVLVFHFRLDRIPAVAVPHDGNPHGSGQNSDFCHFDRQ